MHFETQIKAESGLEHGIRHIPPIQTNFDADALFPMDAQFMLDMTLPISPLILNNSHNMNSSHPHHHAQNHNFNHFDNQNTATLSAKSASSTTSAATITNTHNDAQMGYFNSVQEHTTLSLGVVSYLERLEQEIDDMKRFIALAFKETQSGGRSHEVEMLRLKARNYNSLNVTELDEQLECLPLSNGQVPADVPKTGLALQELNHMQLDMLLDMYCVPFVPSMFLFQKMALYLRFIGANRALMHRVLD